MNRNNVSRFTKRFKNDPNKREKAVAISNVTVNVGKEKKRDKIGKVIENTKRKRQHLETEDNGTTVTVVNESTPSIPIRGQGFKKLLSNETENPLRSVIEYIANPNHKNVTDDIEIYNENGELTPTNIPNNVPVAVIGDKGSGKTTLITAMMEATHETNFFRSIYYIFSSLTLDTETPPFVTRIDVNQADEFLSNIFEIKSLFNSYSKLFLKLESDSIWKDIDLLDSRRAELPDSIDKPKQIKNISAEILQRFLDVCDNQIIKYNQQIVNSGLDPQFVIDKILSAGDNLIQKFSKPFYIGNIRIDGLVPDQRDAVIIDDIAIASKILFRQIKDNPLYTYLTLTRHMRLFILFAGQQIEQIPKTIRREVMCWIVSKNSNLELLTGVISKSAIQQIQTKQNELEKYQFVIYNVVSGYIGII